jgi:ADP-dependent NAD(P)H-hydrate dehydratase / NAD(P)H-hydrate epimerase
MENKPLSIVSASQMREADQFTLTNEPISSPKLMERAAFACFQWIEQKMDLKQHFVIFCGIGNNGGDGLALAKILGKKNCFVSVYVVGDSSKGSDDFKFHLANLKNVTLLPINHIHSEEQIPELKHDCIIVDAIFGAGLNRPIEGLEKEVVNKINQSNYIVISIDLPSGLFCEDNSQNNSGSIVQATYTLTFERPKLAFLLSDFGEKAGEWEILSIGLNHPFLDGLHTPYFFLTKSYIQPLLKKRNKFSHKGNFGHALLVGGSKGKMGAAVLATKAALHSGAGLVTTFVPSCGYEIIQTSCPEAMCVTSNEVDFIDGTIDLNPYQSIGLGPGIGTQPSTSEMVLKIFQQANCPLVIDADALNILSDHRDFMKFVPKNTVLTPHPKEFDRLFGNSESAYYRLQKQLEKSKALSIYILLKGAHSSLSTPSGEVYFNSTGNPGMAKGGSGDVLTGMVSSLLAQAYSPLEATTIGMFIHGLAGDLAEEKYTQFAMNATQLIDCIPKAFILLHEKVFQSINS